MKSLLVFATILCCFWATAEAQLISPSGTGALLTFHATMTVPPETPMDSNSVPKLIELQARHLLGVFERAAFAHLNHFRANETLGIIGLGPRLRYQVLAIHGQEISYRVQYRVVAWHNVLKPGQKISLKFVLPQYPLEIYSADCADPDYPQKEYFFYFWDPFTSHCKPHLVGKNKVDLVEGTLVGLASAPETASPNYDALIESIRQHGELRIGILMGFNNNATDPKDEGRVSYNFLTQYFLSHGFEKDRMRTTPTGPFAELVKTAAFGLPQVRISISLSYSDVASPRVFSRRARQAFENDDLILYMGHSGLGGNLSVENIARLSSPDPSNPEPIHFPNRYQILYLDSCMSYYFYSQSYIDAKRFAPIGDVISNGLASYFSPENPETVAFLSFFINPTRKATWLQILQATEAPIADRYTYLVNVQKVQPRLSR